MSDFQKNAEARTKLADENLGVLVQIANSTPDVRIEVEARRAIIDAAMQDAAVERLEIASLIAIGSSEMFDFHIRSKARARVAEMMGLDE